MWQWLAPLAAIGVAGPAQMMTDVSSPRNDYNLSYDRSGRLRVFARSDADFANARILVSEKHRRRGAAFAFRFGWIENSQAPTPAIAQFHPFLHPR